VECKHNWIPVEFGDPKPKHYLYFGDPKPKHYVYVCKRCHKTIAAQLKEKNGL
jgi:predicted metal-binding protein